MVVAPAVRVPRSEAEATRRRLMELDVLRLDLEVAKEGAYVLFPVTETCGPRLPTVSWDFAPRVVRAADYRVLLPKAMAATAPRAFDTIGDIVIVKVPPELWERRGEIGAALLEFHGGRAVFHDHGVKDPYRTRGLERIAGEGGSLTQVRENGVSLWVDPAAAYYSPRLAAERARVAKQVSPGELVVDLFGGVAPFGIQLARRGAYVHSIDLNPAATALAERNVKETSTGERIRLHTGDAREVSRQLVPADRIVMNLPHAAKEFLDVAARLLRPEGVLHYHEILAPEEADARGREVAETLRGLGWPCAVRLARVVRNYSPQEAHMVFDLAGTPVSGAGSTSPR